MNWDTWRSSDDLSKNPRIYSTVRVGLVDKESGEVIEALYDEAAQYQEGLALALAQFSTEEYPDGNLMRYFSLPDNLPMEAAIKGKIQEARLTAHAVGKTLYAALDLTMSADLTDEEHDAFEEQIASQYRDGWGAEFELVNFPAGADLVYMRLYHDDLSFYTADMFEAMLGPLPEPDSGQGSPAMNQC